MTVRVGINGFGRIGRNFFRAVQAQGADIEIVAVNDLGSVATMAHLLKYDSIHGVLPFEVNADETGITVNGKHILFFHEKSSQRLATNGTFHFENCRVPASNMLQ
ncbi:MAG: glyceraldehyde-3-phosphate dehydrogenase, partial [Actinomycetota bacterium]